MFEVRMGSLFWADQLVEAVASCIHILSLLVSVSLVSDGHGTNNGARKYH